MRPLKRRHFLHLAWMTGLSWLAASCGVRVSPTPGATSTPTALVKKAATAVATAAAAPTAKVRRLLQNANAPGMYVRYFKPFYAPERDEWRLEVKGLVEAPREFTFAEIQAEMPLVVRDTRMKCVECWSARKKWGGFVYAALAEIVRPLPEAKFVHFRCADTYWEVLSTEELAREGVIFVYQLDGTLLPEEYGAPLRMLVPWKYGYKMPKAIVEMEFSAEGGKGYWSTVGPYTVDGDIQAGKDHPLDLEKEPHAITGGEITDY